MFIQTEQTPNPMTLKFYPEAEVLPKGTTKFYTSAKAAEKESPLATALFNIEGVKAVFLGNDFITITKDANIEWSNIKPDLLGCIMDFFVTKKPVLLDNNQPVDKSSDEKNQNSEEELRIIEQIKELLETRVRPAVAQDGGDIIFRSYSEGIVKLELHGACQGCPSASFTLKQGVENMLKHFIPEIIAVEAVEEH